MYLSLFAEQNVRSWAARITSPIPYGMFEEVEASGGVAACFHFSVPSNSFQIFPVTC